MPHHPTSLMTVTDVAIELRLGPSTVWRKVKAGELPAPIKIGGATRWHRSEIEAFISQLTQDQRARCGRAA